MSFVSDVFSSNMGIVIIFIIPVVTVLTVMWVTKKMGMNPFARKKGHVSWKKPDVKLYDPRDRYRNESTDNPYNRSNSYDDDSDID